jgi:1-deoxy-D-xylulose-5-phosphate reductoisomerase
VSALPQLPPHTRSSSARRITILGATGTIGQNTLKIIAAHPGRFTVDTLAARENADFLASQALASGARRAVIADPAHYPALKARLSGTGIEAASGDAALCEAAAGDADIVMSAIVGAAGLRPTLAAIRSGKTVALANKESLVCAGELLMQECRKHGATLIPVDSEHNAIFQLFDTAHPERVAKITITASGGPFRDWPLEQMRGATPEQATRHPNWNMGAKISVDSATLMNKGLELIEAYRLFPMPTGHIDVLIHPQSIVHCLVQMLDGSVLAQLSNPDMCTPIACALAWPERITAPVKPLDLADTGSLQFARPDLERFPALGLAHSALRAGASAPTVLNAANEIAVARFLSGRLGFLDIAKIVERTLETVENTVINSLEDVIAIDADARRIAESISWNS